MSDHRLDDEQLESDMMTIECPWCDGPVEIGEQAVVECATCVVRLDVAPDEDRPLAAAA